MIPLSLELLREEDREVFSAAVLLAIITIPLGCIAGGLVILFSKPFELGDYVSTDGGDGTVEEITLYLKGLTPDEKDIILDGCLMNYYAKRMD